MFFKPFGLRGHRQCPCHDRSSRTTPSAPPAGAVPWILTPIRTQFPIIPHTWAWLSCHTCTSFTHTHTYKQHTFMHSLRSLDLPRLSLLSITTRVCFSGVYLCLDPRLCDSSLVALTRTVSLDSDISRLPWLLCLFIWLRLCPVYAVSIAGDWPCSVRPF